MSYQAVVIGGGPGGYTAAIRLSQLGVKTALVEREELGGECTNWGCIPSKHLISQAKKVWHLKELSDKKFVHTSLVINMHALSEWRRQVVQRLRDGIAYLLKANGVAFIKGEAEIQKPGKVTVRTNGSTHQLITENIVIATGTEPASLPTLPFDQKKIIDYKKALYLESVPEKLLVVGGGAVGLEMGTAYAHLGSQVTVVEVMDQLLPGFDPEAARLLRRSLEKIGVKVFTRTTVTAYSYVDDKVEVKLSNDIKDVFDYVLVSVGKHASAWVKNLPEIGVELDLRGFVKTDKSMKTSVDGIYAVGDVTGPPFLAHKAYRQGVVAAEAIAGLDTRFDGLVPFGVFTSPEVAAVGLTSVSAKESGYEVVETRFPYSALGRAVVDGEEGFVKLVIETRTNRIVGAVVVGPCATETISIITAFIKTGAPMEEISETIYVHPTYSEAVGETIHLHERKAIHYVKR